MRWTRNLRSVLVFNLYLTFAAGATIHAVVPRDPGGLGAGSTDSALSPLMDVNSITRAGEVDLRSGATVLMTLYIGDAAVWDVGTKLSSGPTGTTRRGDEGNGPALVPEPGLFRSEPPHEETSARYWNRYSSPVLETDFEETAESTPGVSATEAATDGGYRVTIFLSQWIENSLDWNHPKVAFGLGGMALLLGWRRPRSGRG
jgi:MYXO-CTERM domain-containing protein